MTDEATEAAAAWGGRILRLLGNRENAVYEVTLPAGRAALRLHRTGYQSEAAIRSEIWWCAALSGAGVAVPAPIATPAGDHVLRLQTGRIASMISWVEGVPLGEAGVPLADTVATQVARHRALGRLIAEVHDATDRLTLPDWFQRPRWDAAGIVGETPFWGRFWEHPALTADEAATLRAARNLLRERLALPGAARDTGLIHADVLRENVLVEGNRLSLIDFDDSGFGFRSHDLGTVLSQNLYEPAFPAIRAALIEGYGERRPVDPGMVDLFTLARTLASVGWTMPRLAPDDPIHRSHIARAVMCARRMLQTSTGMATWAPTPNTRL